MIDRQQEFEQPTPPDCEPALALLQRRLDGEIADAPPEISDHLATCCDCRERFAAARFLLTKLPRKPAPITPFLTERLVSGVVQDLRRQRRLRLTAYAATGLAASIALVFWLGRGNGSRPGPTPQPPEIVQNVKPTPPLLKKELAEAGEAVASLTRRAANQAVDTGRPFVVDVPAPTWPSPIEPSARVIDDAGQALAEGFEPVTTSARRAARMFMRDLPMTEDKQK